MMYIAIVVLAHVIGVLLLSVMIWAGCIARSRRRGKGTAVPPYWESAGSDLAKAMDRRHAAFFADCYPVKVEQRPAIQELMNETCGQDEKAFRLVRACRVENLAVWRRYRESAAVVAQARRACAFAGRPPATARMAEGRDAAFLSSLNEGVCEVYLWYGTDPESAQKIAHEGFASGGPGSVVRFAEDMAKADEAAKPGSHLYQDCFAMLLCRVVLGRQQPMATDEEADTARNTVKFDSAVVESPDCPRAFISYCPNLVYPEYMLVYERCERGHLERGAEHSKYWDYAARHIDRLFRCAEGLRCADVGTRQDLADRSDRCVPGYWSNWSNDEAFCETHPAVRIKPTIQRLMDSTWEAKYTRDRKGANGLRIPRGDPNGDMPVGARVLKVLRVEDSEMWARYVQEVAAIAARRSLCRRISGHDVNTMVALESRERQRLVPSVNEVYLWHGTSPSAVMSIAQTGFNLDLTGSATGAMFGRGAYFAESASKADEYSSDDRDGYYQGYFAVLLCRVALGEVQHLLQSDADAHMRTGPAQPYDSTLGDREAAVGTYREFVVPSRDQIYPEYAIIYERLFNDNRIR